MKDKVERIDEEITRFLIRDKESDDYKVRDEVFDDATFRALYKLAKKGVIKAMGGVISSGKESNVFHAIGENESELAIKIYMIATSDFRRMSTYLVGDPRFQKVKMDKKSIILAWTRKEFRNLKRSIDAGVRVPNPLAVERNVLVMEFIGSNEVPAPRLKDVRPDLEKRDFDKIVEYMSLLHKEANLVHGDLSEFNILYDGDPVFIDMGQSVTLDHPRAEDLLERDIINIAIFFKKLGFSCSEEEMMIRIKN
jgi:RIO kinase 1